MQVLVQMGAKEYAKEVAALLNDPDPNTRKAAMQVLVQMGAKEYAKEVAALPKDPGIRQAALWVLGQMSAKEYAKEVARCRTTRTRTPAKPRCRCWFR